MKAHKEAHAGASKKLKTGEYGTGFKNPVGKVREIMGEKKVGLGSMKKPPKKMA